jgi:predicted CoA-binding protein
VTADVETGRTWLGPSAAERLRIMRRTRTVAMVGASCNQARASYVVATYQIS